MAFEWSWLSAPYFACATVIAVATLTTALVRGDRVLRLGLIGAGVNALPWALCQALAACTVDADVATRLLRLGQGPVALVGPHLLIVLLGTSGQLERFRWIARISGIVGSVFLVLCWATPWTVPSVQRIPSGMYYTAVGPLTGWHISQLVFWLAIGYAIARRATPHGERKRTLRLVFVIFALGGVGSVDMLLLYGIWGSYPVAWSAATIACGIAIYLVLRTDLVRPQGIDRGVALELVAFGVAVAATAGLAIVVGVGSPIALSAPAALAWAAVTAIAWTRARDAPVRAAGGRELDQFVARAGHGDDKKLVERLVSLWQGTVGIAVRAVWRREDGELVEIGGDERRWPLDGAVAAWLVRNPGAFAITDLATMRLGPLRVPIEALVEAHGASLVVPLVDRDELVGLVEADHDRALREAERALVDDSARAAARGLTFAALARAAVREKEVAREVEIADALRLQAHASDAQLGRWAVAAEYRSAPRTTGAGWSAIELPDGRLALLVTEAQAHGVAAALATAALTGAFAAACTEALSLDELARAMQTSADGVMRGGEPVAAFLALVDGEARAIDWVCAGHPGAIVVGEDGGAPVVLGGDHDPRASLSAALRGKTPLPDGAQLVVASSALRGDNAAAWHARVSEAAPTAARLPTALVEEALRGGAPREDLLAVTVRAR